VGLQPAAKALASPPRDCGRSLGHHEDRTPTHGYEPTREAAMAVFAKSWRRETVRRSWGPFSEANRRNRLIRCGLS